MSVPRIAVTGVGMVSALGATAGSTFDRLIRGDRGFSEITLFDTSGQRTSLAGEVRGFRPEGVVPGGNSERWSRSDALALVAAKDALADAFPSGRPPSATLGVAVGVTTAGMLEAEALLVSLPESSPPLRSVERLASYPISSTADRLAEALAPVHRVATVCSACSSGANAIVQGAAWLRLGAADAVLVGGTDALCRLTLTGFNALGATDTVACRPFDRSRAGLTLGEGAAFLVLETEERALRRGAKVIAWLSGWAVGAEAHHITQPNPSARMPAHLLATAIERAGLRPADVDYVNAHGTGTPSNDSVETTGIHAVFGAHGGRVLVSSSKGQIGHTLGAAGALEAAITVLALARGEVPPTGGLAEIDDACRLNHVMGQGRGADLRVAMSSSFGFGGTGAVLLFERVAAERRQMHARERSAITVTAVAGVGPRGIIVGDRSAERPRDDRNVSAKGTFRPLDLLDPARSRRFDAQASFVAVGADSALRSANLAPDGVGIVLGTAFGNVARTIAFVRTAVEKGAKRVPPAEFPHLVPSAASGNAAIYLGLTGPALTTSNLDASAEAAVALALDWVEAELATAMVAGGAEPKDMFVSSVLGPLCEPGSELLGRVEGAAWVVLEREEDAKRRGAVPLAIVRRRYELRTDDAVAKVHPPVDVARAAVVCARDPARARALLERSGWGAVVVLSTDNAPKWNDVEGGFALPAALALLARGECDEALALGWNGARLYLFDLVRPL